MKKYILISVVALLLSSIISIIRSGWFTIGWLQGIPLAMLVDAIVFFVYTLICIKKLKTFIKPVFIVLSIAVGSSIFELPNIILHYKDLHVLFPLEVLLRYVSIFSAYLVLRSKCLFVMGSVVVFNFVLVIWVSLIGSQYIINYKNFGSWKGELRQMVEHDICFQTFEGNVVSLYDYEGCYLILDCWNSKCGNCFEKFPAVQKLYDKYKNSPTIKIAALNCWYENHGETFRTGTEILQKIGYTFPCLSINIKNQAVLDLEVKVFPTVLIFSPDSKLIFRGNLDDAETYINLNILNGF